MISLCSCLENKVQDLRKLHVLSLHFNGHFPGVPGLASTRISSFWILLELRMMEEVVTTGAISRVKLQSNCYYQQTNMHFFFVANQQCQSIKGITKYLLLSV